MQALYDDPELAAAATEASEKMHATKRKKRSKVPPKSSSSRRSRVVSEHPDHIRAMMDEGVPIKQWIILIVLLGAGLYQLRKALVGSSTKAAAVKKVEKPTSGRKGSKKTKKGGAKQTKKARSAPFVRKEDSPIEKELALEEQAPPVAAASPKKTTSKKKKVRKQKSSSKTPPHQQPAKETMSHESPDSVSTDGSSSTDGAAQHDDTMGADESEGNFGAVNDVVIDTSIAAESSSNDGWQTVGAAAVEEAAAPEAPAQAVDKVPAKDPPIKEENVVVKNGSAVAVAEKSKTGAAKAKSSKPAKQQSSSSTKNAKKQVEESTPTMSSEVTETATEILDDEALALKLQLEEDSLANHDANKASHQDVWEEVSTKKKGKRES